MFVSIIFFFKQKAAYELRISDWSSDVCSADLAPAVVRSYIAPVARRLELGAPVADAMQVLAERLRVPEISMLAAAIRTNMRYGGSISAVLLYLANILPERIRINRELRSEARREGKAGVRPRSDRRSQHH